MAARFSGALFRTRSSSSLRVVEFLQIEERASERDAGREVSGVDGEAGAADVHGFLELPRAPVFLGQLGEGDRRRVLLDPPSKIFQPLIDGHA